jgi:hypothetical protein
MRSNIDPQLIRIHDRCIGAMQSREMYIHDGNHPGNVAAMREHVDLLRLVELIPERVRTGIPGSMQPQVALIRNLAHHIAHVIQPARYQATWVARSDRHDEIAYDVTPPP